MKNQIHIGKQIQTIRVMRGLHLRKLGALSGIPYSYLSRFENDKMNPDSTQLQAIEAALGICFSDPAVQAAFSVLLGGGQPDHNGDLPNAQ
jgi:transcriptional regulator with XRE-family HTH domain